VPRKLLWLALGLIGISGLMVAVSLTYLWSQTHAAGEQQVMAIARIVQEQTDRTLQTVDQRLQLTESQLMQMKASGTLNGPSAQAMLRVQIQQLPFVRAMWVMDAQGVIVYDSDVGNIGVNLANRAYFQIYLKEPQTGFNLGPPVKNKDGIWVIGASRPLHHADGRFAGIVVAALLPGYFDALWGSLDLGAGGSVALYSRDGTLLVSNPFADTDVGKGFADLPVFAALAQGNARGAFEGNNLADGDHRHFEFHSLKNYPAVVVVGGAHSVFMSSWTWVAALTLVVWVAFVAVISALVLALARHLAVRKVIEADLQASKTRLAAMLEAVPDLLFEVGIDGRYYDFHSPRRDLMAAPPEALIGKTVTEVMPEPAAEVILAALKEAHQHGFSSGQVIHLDLPIGPRWFELSAAYKQQLQGESPRCVVLSRDITVRVENQQALTAALAERTALLNEVHHRVKNNLQVISSLLRLEATRSCHSDTKAALDEMTGRIRSMALLHETLYRSGTFAQVDLGQYLQALVQQAFRVNASAGAAVMLALDLAHVTVSLDLAGPMGLLVNELISNCLKHAFSGARSGVLRIALQLESGSLWCLSVSDSGPGLADDFDVRSTVSLGMQLVSDLTQQIGGTLKVEAHGGDHGGAMFRILFEIAP